MELRASRRSKIRGLVGESSMNQQQRRRVHERVRRVAVVGTGAIGASWTALYLARGLDVIAADPDPSAEAKLRRSVDTAWSALKVIGLSPKGSPEHLTFTRDPSFAAAQVDFVQECAPERIDVKVKLFAELDSAAPATVILASSASSIPMSLIQAECVHPERCVIGHPVNPPHLVPLVEVVGGQRTSPEVIQRAMAFYASIGRKPIHVRKEVIGHVANRLQAALYREVAYLIDRDVLDVGDIDAAVCWGPGLRWGVMGPNLLFHLGGGEGGIHHFMEHLARPIINACWKDLGSPELTPELQRTIIDGVLKEAGDRSLAHLAQERDQLLVGLLRLRAKLCKAANRKQRLKQSIVRAKADARGRRR
jgi:3-hydroxyacyl-CoA dehydrogenase